ncbi:MAG: hypothetical protein R3Y28_08565 [Candidatus Gastranaerophilales bacterium]
MNIEKLAKHLKEFSLDEIEMISECDCETALKQLLKANKIEFKNEIYKYIEKKSDINFGVFENIEVKNTSLSIEMAIEQFMENYVHRFCKPLTIQHYNAIFKYHILLFFKDIELKNICPENIHQFYLYCKERGLKPRRIKNVLALLNQLIKYYQNLGIIDSRCKFQVKRITSKNEFDVRRIVFKGGN